MSRTKYSTEGSEDQDANVQNQRIQSNLILGARSEVSHSVSRLNNLAHRVV